LPEPALPDPALSDHARLDSARSDVARPDPALPEPALRTSGLTWQAGGARILDQVGLTVRRGEFLAVIGPNGAGKTSLFNLVTGLRRPTAGTIELLGRDVTALPVHRRSRAGLGRSFQSSSLFGSLSVRDTVRLAVAAKQGAGSLVRSAARARAVNAAADECVDQVGLSDLADRPATLLSHGDQRKVEIAALLAGRPAVLLLDEPLAGVAAADVPGLVEVIRTLTGGGRTVLMVEHHIDAVLDLADRIAVLHHGAVLACADAAAVLADASVQEAYLGEPV
jgi:branched-chain amino acid transport system ATP-binding protein